MSIETLPQQFDDSVATLLRQAIYLSLDHNIPENAVFLAERLNAHASSDDTILILATAHYRAGNFHSARQLLKPCQSLSCKILYAKCCLQTQLLQEALCILSDLMHILKQDEKNSKSNLNIPAVDLASFHYLYGEALR